MRLDHIAYRVKNRHKTAMFFCRALGYRVQKPFKISFPDGSTAECYALEPPEKQQIPALGFGSADWTQRCDLPPIAQGPGELIELSQEYHLAPEIFVSDGTPGSIVDRWVQARGGVGGIHHLAYQVESVEDTMGEWLEKGYAEFTTDKPLTCPGLTQVFTKPSELTGVIYEFIEREGQGFCEENVMDLMTSTADIE